MRGSDRETRFTNGFILSNATKFQSPCGEVIVKLGNVDRNHEYRTTAVSVPLRGSDRETMNFNASTGWDEGFQSPCGEVIVKRVNLTIFEAPMKVSVPLRGSDRETTVKLFWKNVTTLFQSPCGEVIVKPLLWKLAPSKAP